MREPKCEFCGKRGGEIKRAPVREFGYNYHEECLRTALSETLAADRPQYSLAYRVMKAAIAYEEETAAAREKIKKFLGV